MPKPVPIAALGTMAYGEFATFAVAAVPLLVKVTPVTVSPLTNPLVVNYVKVGVVPYVLEVFVAVIVNGAGVTVNDPLT